MNEKRKRDVRDRETDRQTDRVGGRAREREGGGVRVGRGMFRFNINKKKVCGKKIKKIKGMLVGTKLILVLNVSKYNLFIIVMFTKLARLD